MRGCLSCFILVFFSVSVACAAPPLSPKPAGKPVSAPSNFSPVEAMRKINPAQEPPSLAAMRERAEVLVSRPAVADIVKDPQLLGDLINSKEFRDNYLEFESNVETRKEILEFLKLQRDLRKATNQESNFIVSTRNIMAAARAAGNLPDGAVFRRVDAKEVEMLMRDGYVTATAYPDNPPLADVKVDINGILKSPQALQRALIHHDTNNGVDSFVKSATVSEKVLLSTIADYAESYPTQYVLVLNPRRALINQFNNIWHVEGEVVFPGYIELGSDVIGYMNPQTGKYVPITKNPIISQSSAAAVRDFQVLVDANYSKSDFDNFSYNTSPAQKYRERAFLKAHPTPFIDSSVFKEAVRAYENMSTNTDRLRRIAPPIDGRRNVK
jgi:hypothetical protein